MSYKYRGSILERLRRTNSIKSFAENFLLPTMAGQKIFLHNEDLPRVLNLSFIEKTCMYSCRMCPYSDKKVREHYKHRSEMNFSTLERIVDSVPNDSFHSFDMSAIGETLEFKPLPEFIGYMKKKRPRVNTIVSTNGVLLTEDLFLRLADNGLDSLQLSMFAGTGEDHEHITGTTTYERVTGNLERVVELRERRGIRKPFIQTFLLEAAETTHAKEEFLKRWTGRVDKAFARPLLKRGMQIEGLTPLYDFKPAEERRPCMQPWYSSALNSKGEVLPCYAYHWWEGSWGFNFGNINDSSLRQIWASEKFREFRRRHLALQLEGLPCCEECVSWNDYTDIWEKETDGGYRYAPVSLKDFLTPCQRAARRVTQRDRCGLVRRLSSSAARTPGRGSGTDVRARPGNGAGLDPEVRMRIACIGNMNNNFFPFVRFLRGQGLDAHLFLTRNEPEHFHPSADSFDSEYETYTTQLSWGDPLSFLATPAARIAEDLAGYDVLIGTGLAPAFLSKAGMTLDVYQSYGWDMYQVPFKRISLTRYPVLWFKLSGAQKCGIRHAKHILLGMNLHMHPIIKKIKPRGQLHAVSAPFIYTSMYCPEQAENIRAHSPWNAEFKAIRARSKFVVIQTSRQIWKTKVDAFSCKGNDVLISGFARFVQSGARGADPVLILCEYGLDVEASKALIDSLGIRDSVVWLPKMQRKDLMAALSYADVCADQFCFSYLTGGTAYEALAMAKPLLTYRDDAEFVRKGMDLYPVLNARDADDVAQILSRYSRDPASLKSIGERGRQWLAAQAIEKPLKEFGQILRELDRGESV